MVASPHFPLPIRGEWLSSRKFKLLEQFIYNDAEFDMLVVVPPGFVTDFNSSPRAVWAYFAPVDVLEAGVVHDWLYDHPDGFESLSYRPPLSKADCDRVHRRILELKGMRITKRNTIYWLLRSAGFLAWNRHRRKDGELSKILNN